MCTEVSGFCNCLVHQFLKFKPFDKVNITSFMNRFLTANSIKLVYILLFSTYKAFGASISTVDKFNIHLYCISPGGKAIQIHVPGPFINHSSIFFTHPHFSSSFGSTESGIPFNELTIESSVNSYVKSLLICIPLRIKWMTF